MVYTVYALVLCYCVHIICTFCKLMFLMFYKYFFSIMLFRLDYAIDKKMNGEVLLLLYPMT